MEMWALMLVLVLVVVQPRNESLIMIPSECREMG